MSFFEITSTQRGEFNLNVHWLYKILSMSTSGLSRYPWINSGELLTNDNQEEIASTCSKQNVHHITTILTTLIMSDYRTNVTYFRENYINTINSAFLSSTNRYKRAV